MWAGRAWMHDLPGEVLDRGICLISPPPVSTLRRGAGLRIGMLLYNACQDATGQATAVANEVCDPLRLQQILGHTSLEMVRRYVSMANVQRSLIDRRGSPMDLIANPQLLSPNARRLQARKPRKLRVVRWENLRFWRGQSQLKMRMSTFSPLAGIAEQRRRMVPTRLTRVK